MTPEEILAYSIAGISLITVIIIMFIIAISMWRTK